MTSFSQRADSGKTGPRVALERRLRHSPLIVTLGVRPNFSDYSRDEQSLIRASEKIYYPSTFYADLLDVMGIKTFPSYHTYKFAQDKIKQTALFQMTGLPHPRTRIYYGPRQISEILTHFKLPLIAKVARGSALGQGVFIIRTTQELDQYCQNHSPAYIQEYIPLECDIRVVIIGSQSVHAYWRIGSNGDFRTNVAQGGHIDLSPVPRAAIELALLTAHTCGWDDVGIDICEYQGSYMVLEANMKYGLEGFRSAGIDYHQLLDQMIENETI